MELSLFTRGAVYFEDFSIRANATQKYSYVYICLSYTLATLPNKYLYTIELQGKSNLPLSAARTIALSLLYIYDRIYI